MPHNPEYTDIDLVERCLSGSESAWLEFFHRFEKLVRMVVKRRLGTYQDRCEDMVQEVFINLISALETFEPGFRLKVFVCTVAERVCVDRYRFETASKRSGKLLSLDDPDFGQLIQAEIDNPSKSQEDLFYDQERSHILRKAFRSLGARCRELLKLRFYEELNYSEITKILGGTENTLAVQASRCIAQLRAHFMSLHKEKALS